MPAAIWRACAKQLAAATTQSIIAMILGVGAMVAAGRGGGSGMGQAGAAAIAGADLGDPEFDVQLHARPGGPGRSRRPSSFSPPPASPPRACTRRSSGSPTRSSIRRATSILTCSRTRCRASAWRRSRGWRRQARTGTTRIRRRCRLRHDLMRAKLYGFLERPDAVARRYPPSDTSLRRALRARHRVLSLLRGARRACADRRAHPGAAAKSIFLRAQGPGLAGSRTAGRGGRARCVTRSRSRPIPR